MFYLYASKKKIFESLETFFLFFLVQGFSSWYMHTQLFNEQLIRSRFQSKEKRLFDDVLGMNSSVHDTSIFNDVIISWWVIYLICLFPAVFVFHHPEHGHAIILPIISCIIDGTLEYNRNDPPFASFISLFCPGTEVRFLIECILHFNFFWETKFLLINEMNSWCNQLARKILYCGKTTFFFLFFFFFIKQTTKT